MFVCILSHTSREPWTAFFFFQSQPTLGYTENTCPQGMTPFPASFRLELSARLGDVKCWCQKALCSACPCWQVWKLNVLPDQHKRMEVILCCSSHIGRPMINRFLCCQSAIAHSLSLSEFLSFPACHIHKEIPSIYCKLAWLNSLVSFLPN